MKEWGDPLFCLLWGHCPSERKGKALSQESGKKGGVAQRVWEMAQPLAEQLGLALWDVQFVKEGADWYLRIFIDKEEGVSIDDCVDMTHLIDPVLDREDPIPQEYMLEVSSPGLERKLVRPEHFQAWAGKPVRVKLIRPREDGNRELKGVLLDAGPDGGFMIRLADGTSVSLDKKECSSVNAAEEI